MWGWRGGSKRNLIISWELHSAASNDDDEEVSENGEEEEEEGKKVLFSLVKRWEMEVNEIKLTTR